MKTGKILFTFLMLIIGVPSQNIQAQNLWVTSLIGDFYLLKNKKQTELQANDPLTPKDILRTPAKGKLVIFDSTNRKEHEIRTSTSSTMSVDKLINSNEKVKTKALTDVYFKYLCHQIARNIDPARVENVPTAVIRDLVLLSDSILIEPEDSLKYIVSPADTSKTVTHPSEP